MPVPSSRIVIWFLLVILICVASSALIQYVVSPRTREDAIAQKENKYKAANSARVRELLEKSGEAKRQGRYAEALDNLRDAERSVPRLSPEQYASLQKSREEIAEQIELSGAVSEAAPAYSDLISSSLNQGDAQESGDAAGALVEYQRAAQFSERLTTEREASFLRASRGIVRCLVQLQRYPEAEERIRQNISRIESTAGEYSRDIAEQYFELADMYSRQGNWSAEEETLILLSRSADEKLAKFGANGTSEARAIVSDAVSQKSDALFFLIREYSHQGNVERTLSTADEYYGFDSQSPSQQREVARMALSAAQRAGRKDAVALWNERLSNNKH